MVKRSTYRGFGFAALLLATKVVASTAVIGNPAPDFVLPSLGDGNQRISEYRSEVVLITFLSPGCIPCRESIQLSTQLDSRFGQSGLKVIGITVSRNPAFARAFAADYGVAFPMLLDLDAEVSSLYELTESSMTVVLDQEGNIVFIEEGFRQDSAQRISALVADMVAG